MKTKFLVLLLSCLTFSNAHAKLLFEGYRKVELKGHHIGYVIHKDEIDDATKQRTVTYFIWENLDGNVMQNAVQVVAKPAPPPAYYSGVSLTSWSYAGDEGTKSVGKFEGKTLQVTTTDVKTGEVIEYKTGKQKVPADSIFSVMGTTTLAESSPSKYVTGTIAKYTAIEEETQKYDTLELKILDTKTFNEQKVLQVIADLRNDRYELYTSTDGQSIGFRDAYTDRIDYLVSKRDDAFGEFGQSDMIKKIFGDVPRGLRNVVSDAQGKLNAKEVIESFASLKARQEQEQKKKR